MKCLDCKNAEVTDASDNDYCNDCNDRHDSYARLREMKILRDKVNDYNNCHKFSYVSIKFDGSNPYIKMHRNV